MPQIIPRTRVPELRLPLVGGGTWSVHDATDHAAKLIIFYRGLHCPVCRKQLAEIERSMNQLRDLNIDVVATSADVRERAERSKEEWRLERLPIGYGVTVETALEWGLFISGKTKEPEPEVFSEPGVFIVKPDGTLWASIVASMPFARPETDGLIMAIGRMLHKNYPARGEKVLS